MCPILYLSQLTSPKSSSYQIPKANAKKNCRETYILHVCSLQSVFLLLVSLLFLNFKNRFSQRNNAISWFQNIREPQNAYLLRKNPATPQFSHYLGLPAWSLPWHFAGLHFQDKAIPASNTQDSRLLQTLKNGSGSQRAVVYMGSSYYLLFCPYKIQMLNMDIYHMRH